MTVSKVIGGALAAALSTILISACAKSPEEPPAEEARPAAAAQSGGPSSHSVVGKAPAAVNGMPSVIVLEPQEPREYPAPAERAFMDQITQTFVPAFLFVRTGYPTDFRNSDDVLHNVRVREEATKSGTFNVAIPTGQIYTHTFEREGFYDVGCDIHPGMSAQIIATRSPYATLADPAGNFTFADVEPGAYKVAIYSGTERIEKAIDVSGTLTTVGD
jgi:plastocyanin